MAAVDQAQATAISNGVSLKNLGIWLNMNKQKNVDSVETVGQPVAVKAGFLDLLISFGVQFGLGALGIGQGLGGELQKEVSATFGSFGTWLDGQTGGVFSSVSSAVSDVWKDITVTSTPMGSCTAASVEADLASAGKDVSLSTQFTNFVKPKIEALTKFADDLYKKDLVPGDTNFSMEDAFNAVNKKFTDVSKVLKMPEITLKDTISSMTNVAALSTLNTKLNEFSDLANNPASTLTDCQNKLNEVQTSTDALHAEMQANQQSMTDAKARQAVLDEVDSIFTHIKAANQQIADYTAEGDTTNAGYTQDWLTTFRSGIAPEILSFVDDMILYDEQRFDPAYTTTTTTAAATPAPNSEQVVGKLSA
jgi:hypothetical protein